MSAGRAIALILAVSGVLMAGCDSCALPQQENPNVNEENFIRVVCAGDEKTAREILGEPEREGEGEVVKYDVPGEIQPRWTITNGGKDYYLSYSGVTKPDGKESVQLLYSQSDRKLVAAEYLLSGVQNVLRRTSISELPIGSTTAFDRPDGPKAQPGGLL